MRPIALLALLLATLALAVAGCGGDDESGADDPDVTVTEPTETDDGDGEETESDGEETEGDAANGEQIFASAGCGGCHTLSAAGTNGSVGPNLDDASPSYDLVVERVTNGAGAMPSFEGDLSTEEIQDVAAYVSSSVS